MLVFLRADADLTAHVEGITLGAMASALAGCGRVIEDETAAVFHLAHAGFGLPSIRALHRRAMLAARLAGGTHGR